MESIEFDHISLSKKCPFKNISGYYCFINYYDSRLIIDLPESNVVFDVNTTYTKPNLFIELNNKDLLYFNEKLKTTLLKLVYETGMYQLSIDQLDGYYVNPYKNIQFKKKYIDSLKIKMAIPQEIYRGNKIKGKLHISGMWFGENSFGPYMNLSDIEVINKKVIPLFLEESDSELELN
jgi:hypothetical protein